MNLSEHQNNLLHQYSDAVIKSPSWLGLTAANERDRFWERHVLDALAMLDALPQEWAKKPWKVADVGTGNGVPGVPMAIATPDWNVFLIDSDNKKIGFLEQFCNSNEINNSTFIAKRAEIVGHEETRESFHLVFARALSKLPTALELTAPLVQVGGNLIVSHGTSWPSELKASEKAMRALNIKFQKAIPYFAKGDGVILIFSKEEKTPDQFPRRTGVPTKKPL